MKIRAVLSIFLALLCIQSPLSADIGSLKEEQESFKNRLALYYRYALNYPYSRDEKRTIKRSLQNDLSHAATTFCLCALTGAGIWWVTKSKKITIPPSTQDEAAVKKVREEYQELLACFARQSDGILLQIHGHMILYALQLKDEYSPIHLDPGYPILQNYISTLYAHTCTEWINQHLVDSSTNEFCSESSCNAPEVQRLLARIFSTALQKAESQTNAYISDQKIDLGKHPKIEQAITDIAAEYTRFTNQIITSLDP